MGLDLGVGGPAARWALLAAFVLGGTYLFGMTGDANPTVMLAWKGAGVWLLAIYAALNARSNDGWLIAVVMAMGALGDVLVERNVTAGAAAFAVGHIIAAILYLRHRRVQLDETQKWLGIVTVPAVVMIGWSLTHDPMATLYSLFLGVMAASAWISRFPRYRVGIGAMLFVASDLLIFARMGTETPEPWMTFAIWLLYFVGQVLIVLGVTEMLSARDADQDLAHEG